MSFFTECLMNYIFISALKNKKIDLDIVLNTNNNAINNKK